MKKPANTHWMGQIIRRLLEHAHIRWKARSIGSSAQPPGARSLALSTIACRVENSISQLYAPLA
eukprot:6367262-Ditylum_brightwellii.AAC.1